MRRPDAALVIKMQKNVAKTASAVKALSSATDALEPKQLDWLEEQATQDSNDHGGSYE
jgi:hypothetical protein